MFILAFIVLLLRMFVQSQSAAPTVRRYDVAPLMKLAQLKDATAAQLRAGARYATLIGYHQAATALARRADFVAQVQQVVAALTGDVKAQAEPLLTPPWPDVDPVAWQQYVQGSRLSAEERGGRTWLVGIFGLAPRLLEQIGLMCDVHRSGEGWEGEWTGLIALAQWPVSGQIQALAAISRLHREECADTINAAVGQEIEGRRATVSGLLAVALRAGGCKGLASWLADPQERQKFRSTTAAYARLNGLF